MAAPKKIYVGTDHRGFQLKQQLVPQLQGLGYEVIDCGAKELIEGDDYTDYAFEVGRKVVHDKESRGLLFCGSGIGMGIAVNKINGVIASQVAIFEDIEEDRKEHNSNVLVIGADDVKNPEELVKVIDSWMKADFAKGRHMRRINKIRFYEKKETLPYSAKPLIVPAILTADSQELYDQFNMLKDEVPVIHIDVIDPEFVAGETVGIEDVVSLVNAAVIDKPELFFNIHLMLKQPQVALEMLNNLGNIYTVYIHHEAEISGILAEEWSFQLGLALNPDTSVTDLGENWQKYDVIKLMTVVPGKQGNEFRNDVLGKIPLVRQIGFQGEVHLDGGINLSNFDEACGSKPDVVNIGSAIVRQPDPIAEYKKFIEKLQK